MDRNQAIGLTLMALVLLIYFIWFAPQPEPLPPVADSLSTQQAPSAAQLPTEKPLTPDSLPDEAARPAEIDITTRDLKLTFSTRGGTIRSLELLHYKTYHQKPLRLIDPDRHEFELVATVNGQPLNLYALNFRAEQHLKGDTTILSFTRSANDRFVQFIYTIPPAGYEIGYRIINKNYLDNSTAELRWKGKLALFERDLTDSRNFTTIVYRHNDEVDELSARSSTEQQTLAGNINWVSVKQKFFLNAIVSEKGFSQAVLQTSVPEQDTSIVKYGNFAVQIPAEQIAEGKVNLKFYFGPNDYQTIGKVAPQFAKNVYLGWPPVYWINKYVIFPVFHFLTKVFSNFGLIIIILVILLRIVLLPLSYRSYLSMAKMKVLKPELDEIKEKFGDDMTKVQQEQLKLYQQAGVNPLSGCIPILLQMPILFAMFYLFPNSIELRQQSFLWADDLSTYDSVINLPFTLPLYGNHVSLFTLLMTLSTLIITWQNNQISSVQGPMKSMSYIMPVVFMVVLNSFPAGLSFYYLMSNLVTFGQQAIIRRFVDEAKIKKIMDEHRKAMAAGNGKKSKFMARLEEAMKASEEARRRAEEERKKRKK